MQKKILVLASTFPINDSDNVPSFVEDQIIEFKKSNPSIKFIVLAPSIKNINPQKNDHFIHLRYRYFFKKMEKLTEKGILPTVKSNPLYAFLIPFFIIFQIYFTIKIVNKNKPDHIYAHWVTPQAITALIIKKLYKIPFSFSSHAHDAEILIKLPFVGKYLLNLIVKNSYKFTFDSINTEKKLKKHISKKNWDPSKSLVLPMGVNNMSFDNVVRKEINEFEKTDSIKIGFIGRFTEKKGVEILIEAFTQLLKLDYAVELILCGMGPLENKYTEILKNSNISDKTKLLKFFNNNEKLATVYELTDIIVIPSIITKGGDVEGLPVVSLEALYFGKIVVGSIQSNLNEIINHGQNGFLFNSDNPEELITLLQDILDNKYDLETIKVEARNLGKMYSIEKTSKLYFDHLF
tara:strand:- start:4826 stop:6043 length:1218 start_codon:yes stop_codon:yes gene_type:complete